MDDGGGGGGSWWLCKLGSVMAEEEMQIGLSKKVFAILKLYFRVFMKWAAKNRVYNIYTNFFSSFVPGTLLRSDDYYYWYTQQQNEFPATTSSGCLSFRWWWAQIITNDATFPKQLFWLKRILRLTDWLTGQWRTVSWINLNHGKWTIYCKYPALTLASYLVKQHEWKIKVIEVVAQSSCWIDFII